MSLRFSQSLQIEPQHEREVRRQLASSRSFDDRRGDLYLGPVHGHEGGAGVVIGRKVAGPELLGLDEEKRSGRGFKTPSWLDGAFRPRNLGPDGLELLQRLDPARVSEFGGVQVLQAKPWASLEERMAYLRAKYLALDLVRKGFVVEADGRFWPKVLAREAARAEAQAFQRRRELVLESPLSVQDAIVWAGAFREASWDQMRALHPQAKDGVDHLIQALLDRKVLEAGRVQMGQGSLSTLRLDRKGLEFLEAMPEGRDLLNRGFGPRHVGRGVGEYHEQAVGDGLGYFAHEAQASGAQVTGFTLEPGLRREYLGAEHVPDFRVEFENDFGRASWDVEVLGVSGDYRSAKKGAKVASSATVRGFDPMGRAGSRSKDVGVSR